MATTDKKAYQLATANEYRLPNLVNVARLRKLDQAERKRYTENFWDVSSHLKVQDRIAKDQSTLNDVNTCLAEATQHHLEEQRRGAHADFSEITQLANEKRETEKAVKEACTQQAALDGDTTEVRQYSQARRAPTRFENA